MSTNFLSKHCQVWLETLGLVTAKAKNISPEETGDLVTKAFKNGLAYQKPNILQMFNEFIINGMLSGLGTPVVNFTSNSIQVVARPTLELLKSLPKGAAARREARAMFSSITDGLASDLIFFKQGWKTGLPTDFVLTPKALGKTQKQFDEYMEAIGVPTNALGVVDPEVASRVLGETYDYMTKSIPGKTGEIIRVPVRLTVAIDEYFKARLRSQKTLGLISKKASADEVKGLGSYEDLYKQYKKTAFSGDPTLYANRIENVFGDDRNFSTALYDVRNWATDGTFQTKLTGGLTHLQELKGSGRTLGETALIQVFPFVKTPWNVTKEGASYVPGLGVLLRPSQTKATAFTDIYGKTMIKNEVVRMPLEDMVARQVVGLGITAGVYGMFKGGTITGAMPDDASERSAWQAAGKEPMSIKVNDVWVSYARLDPLATVLGLATDVFSLQEKMASGAIKENERTSEILKQGWSTLKANILQKTFMQGFADMANAIDSPDSLKSYFQNVSKRVIPAVSNTIARGSDPFEREAITTAEKLQQRIPGARLQLPVQYDKFSGVDASGAPMVSSDQTPMPRQTNLSQAITGIGIREEPSPFQKQMKEIGVAFRPASRKMGKQELTAEQYSYYKEWISRYASPVFLRNSKRWEGEAQASPQKKRQLQYYIESRLMPVYTKAARMKLMSKYPDLRKEIQSQTLFDKGLE